MADIIKNIVTRVDSTANWTTLNPVPANGEQCIEVLGRGMFKLKVGDGETPWIALKYVTMGNEGHVDDVMVNGMSVVTNRVAYIDLPYNPTDYYDLENKPAIDGVVLTPDTTKEDLGIYPLPNSQVSEMPEITPYMYGLIVQYVGETTEEYTQGYFYKAIKIPGGFRVDEEHSRLTGISNVTINQEYLREALESYGLTLPLDFQADHRHYWTCVSPLGGSSLGIGEQVLNEIWGITWEGTPEYETPDQFTIIDIEEGPEHGVWVRVDVQPSVDITNEPNKLYGTDEEGNQTNYDMDLFGLVDDVLVDGKSVVDSEKIAHIDLTDRIRKLEELPTVPESTSDGEIVQYIGITDENYINGYFYKATEYPIESTLEHHIISATLDDEDISTNKATFEEFVQPTENTIIHFIYNAETSSWMLDEETVNLADYGIEINSVEIPEDGDDLCLDYRVATYAYSWTQINVQPETDISEKQDKDHNEVYKVGFNGGWEDANSIVDAGSHIAKTDNDDGTVTIDVDDITDDGLDITADDTGLTTGKAVYEYGETKVSQTDTTSQLYGTDDQGEQTTYDISDFQETLVNQVNIKSVNGESLLGSGNLELGQCLDFPDTWPVSSSTTTREFCDAVAEDSSAVAGKMYLGEVRFSDLSTVGLINAEIVVKIMKGTTTASKVIVLDMTSGNHAPYRWQYTYWNHGSAVSGWIGFVPTTDVAFKVYGTDAQGGQTLYDLSAFGQVDDVQLNGTSVVDVNKIANIEPEASDVAYTHPDYPSLQTVEDALDHLLYIEPTVSLHLDQTLSTYEIGSSINSVGLRWTWNKTITSQSLNQGIGDLATNINSYTYTPTNPIDSNITFTITGGDGVETATDSVSVSFIPKRYWGVSASTSLTDADILALSQELSTSRTQTRHFDCSGGKYFYFVIKTSYCNNIGFKVNGMTFTDMDVETRNFTNGSGYTDQYNIYRVHNIQTGTDIPVEVL